ncbi:MAG: CDP-glucose 4,6-dehydratase [Acidimicrobiales bacterium]|nr:CDP-glucose 4,6-dehydratase [Acidimicrobiales bacterium]
MDSLRGQSVLVTGHTGFKGGWLSLFLKLLGAEVHGYSLDPDKKINFFDSAGVAKAIESDTRSDIRDLSKLISTVKKFKPTVIFHLAAQPLVLEGYIRPRETWETNLMGSVNLLEAARSSESVRAVVVVTTDKVYEPREVIREFVESDRLGGYDPYSASKSSVENVAESYRRSFPCNESDQELRIASARSGNVIGGGDWSENRLIPDCIKSVGENLPLLLRNPESVRPWQHVLEPIFGYLNLANHLNKDSGKEFAKSWNFGPPSTEQFSAFDVANLFFEEWGSEKNIQVLDNKGLPEEVNYLTLDSSQAETELGWERVWGLQDSLRAVVDWHKSFQSSKDMHSFSLQQISDYLDEGGSNEIFI